MPAHHQQGTECPRWRRACQGIHQSHGRSQQQTRQQALQQSRPATARHTRQSRRRHAGDDKRNHADQGRSLTQLLERQTRHGGCHQRPRPHGAPGHGAQAQQADEHHLARRQAEVREQRYAYGHAHAEAGDRLGKRRDAMHHQQHGARAAAGPGQQPVGQGLLRSRRAQHLGQQQPACHDQQHFQQHRRPVHARGQPC